MNGIHDLGGMHGFGPISPAPEADEPAYHAPWEATVYGMFSLLLRRRHWSLDRFRLMIESQTPDAYLSHTYFENWFASISRLVTEAGMVQADELRTGVATEPPPPSPGPWEPVFDSAAAPRFTAGDRVLSVNRHPVGHTRQPRYVRGRTGTIVRHVGAEPLPELAAENVCRPSPVYLVRFEAEELWGADAAGRRDAVYIELWDDYLEPAA